MSVRSKFGTLYVYKVKIWHNLRLTGPNLALNMFKMSKFGKMNVVKDQIWHNERYKGPNFALDAFKMSKFV